MKLSIVTTLYRSADTVREFHQRMSSACRKITNDYEIVFINNGSPDDSLDQIIDLHHKDSHIKAIDLSRNYGHQKAMMTGLKYAKGDFVFLIDCDIEEPPEALADFWKEMEADKTVDVVYGVQKRRKGQWFEKISGAIFYRLFNFLSNIKIPPNIITSRLMTRRYVDGLTQFKESEVFIGGLWLAAGFNQKPLFVEKKSLSKSSYTIHSKFSLLISAVTSFSNRPLIYIFYLGCFITSFSLCYTTYIIYRKLAMDISIAGWASLIASIWLVGGLLIFSLGIIGIYLAKVYMEIKSRPYALIKNIYSHED